MCSVTKVMLLALVAHIHAADQTADAQKDDKAADHTADAKDDMADLLAQLPDNDEDMDKLVDKLADKLVDRAASAFNFPQDLNETALDDTALLKPEFAELQNHLGAASENVNGKFDLENLNLDELQKHFTESLGNLNLDEMQKHFKESLGNLNLDETSLNAMQDPDAINDAIRKLYSMPLNGEADDDEEGAAARPYDEFGDDLSFDAHLQAALQKTAAAFSALAAEDAAERAPYDAQEAAAPTQPEQLAETTASADYYTMFTAVLMGLFVGSGITFAMFKFHSKKVRQEGLLAW